MTSSGSKLLQVTEDEKLRILQANNSTPEEFAEKIRILGEWVKQNKNFSEEYCQNCNENRLILCLLNCKLSLEQTKRAIEGYLTIRTMHDDFFDNLVANEYFINKTSKLTRQVTMPKLLPNLNRLHVAKMVDAEGLAKDGLEYNAMVFMIVELRFNGDFFLSNEILVDFECMSWKSMLKFTPSVNYKLVHYLNALQIRIHKIHFINRPPIWDRVWFVMKSVLPQKLIQKCYVHDSLEELHEHIPKEYLPSDYGGTEKSMEEYQALWRDEIIANNDYLIKATKFKLKELPNHNEAPSETMGMGAEGSFKKLSFD